jgi:hypothetical protein
MSMSNLPRLTDSVRKADAETQGIRFPRLALIGYTAMTIAGYLVMGPYFTLGFIAKGIEVALVTLLVIDIIRVYGGPFGLVRTALESVGPIVPERFGPDLSVGSHRRPKGGPESPVCPFLMPIEPVSHQMSLCSTAYRAAWVREARASLPRMFETWVRAVRSVMPSS